MIRGLLLSALVVSGSAAAARGQEVQYEYAPPAALRGGSGPSPVSHSTIDRGEPWPSPGSQAVPPYAQLPGVIETFDEGPPSGSIPTFAPAGSPGIQTSYQSPEVRSLSPPTFRQVDPLIDSQGGPVMDSPPLSESSAPFAEPQPWMTFKDSVLTGTWVPAGSDQLGLTDFDVQTSLVIPAWAGFSITPGFQMHFVDGPTSTDLPGQLYNARVEFALQKQVSRQCGVLLGVAPGIYTDSENTGSDSVRIVARAVAFYYISYTTQIVLGGVYLDREDVPFLPAVGIIHQAGDDLKLELVFPRPKVSYRFRQFSQQDLWGYLLGEFGGGSWAIDRTNGMQDIANITDWRAIVGLELKNSAGPSVFAEAGYVFNRTLEYRSGAGDYDPDNTFMVRGGMRY